MQNGFSHIRLDATKAETACAALLVSTCKLVLGENIFNHFRVNHLITFSANSNRYFQHYGQSSVLAKISVANNQQQGQQGQQQNQQNSSWNSNREK